MTGSAGGVMLVSPQEAETAPRRFAAAGAGRARAVREAGGMEWWGWADMVSTFLVLALGSAALLRWIARDVPLDRRAVGARDAADRPL